MGRDRDLRGLITDVQAITYVDKGAVRSQHQAAHRAAHVADLGAEPMPDQNRAGRVGIHLG
jgi:hypothetical protein